MFSLFFLLIIVQSAESYVKLREGINFGEEHLLGNSSGKHDEIEGSGEDPDHLLTGNSTSTSYSTTSTSTSTTTSPAKPINCYDISKQCASLKALCTREEYKNIMIRQCAKTCDACPQFVRLPPSARCRDSFHSCPTWARNGFCHSTYYTQEERRTFCKKSCQAC